EEQSVPEQRKLHKLISPKERAIEHRLRQPISLNFKEVPLEQAIKDLTIASGIQVAPDMPSLQDARVKLDAPVTIVVDNISMKAALDRMVAPFRLRWIIENEAVMITTQEKGSRLARMTYNVGDLIVSMAQVDGKAKRAGTFGESLKELIQNNVARSG